MKKSNQYRRKRSIQAIQKTTATKQRLKLEREAKQIFKWYKRTCLCGCRTWIPFYSKDRRRPNRYYQQYHHLSDKKQRPEQVKKWAESRKGYRHSDQVKRNIAAGMVRFWANKKQHTSEALSKMSSASSAWWNEERKKERKNKTL